MGREVGSLETMFICQICLYRVMFIVRMVNVALSKFLFGKTISFLELNVIFKKICISGSWSDPRKHRASESLFLVEGIIA